MPIEDARTTDSSRALMNQVHQELRASFLESIPGRLAEIQRHAEALRLQVPPTPKTMEALHAETHRLAGTSAVYGFMNTSTVVRRFNDRLLEGLATGNLALSIDILRAFLAELDAALQTDS